jgi:hypothetical protein
MSVWAIGDKVDIAAAQLDRSEGIDGENFLESFRCLRSAKRWNSPEQKAKFVLSVKGR